MQAIRSFRAVRADKMLIHQNVVVLQASDIVGKWGGKFFASTIKVALDNDLLDIGLAVCDDMIGQIS